MPDDQGWGLLWTSLSREETYVAVLADKAAAETAPTRLGGSGMKKGRYDRDVDVEERCPGSYRLRSIAGAGVKPEPGARAESAGKWPRSANDASVPGLPEAVVHHMHHVHGLVGRRAPQTHNNGARKLMAAPRRSPLRATIDSASV